MKIWNLGYPRIGKKRELKTALEEYWTGKISKEALKETTYRIREERWRRQAELGVQSIPVNDFSLYDHMLDMALCLGVIPERFRKASFSDSTDLFFAMARGCSDTKQGSLTALDMTKWFNSNYHYLVPEIDSGVKFEPDLGKLIEELEHCRKLSYSFHPVLVGPWTFVRLSRLQGITEGDVIKQIIPVYLNILKEMKKRKFDLVQMDEPALCTDPVKDDVRRVRKIYEELAAAGTKIMLTTYFESPDPWLSDIANFPVGGVHFDLVHGSATGAWLKTKAYPKDKFLSLGVVNGRNIWLSPLKEVFEELRSLSAIYGEKIWLAPSCSLLHLPHDKKLEKKWDKEFLSWVAFADQRLEELSALSKALAGDKTALKYVEETDAILKSKMNSPRVHRPEVKQAVERIDATMKTRKSAFSKRIVRQVQRLGLPLLPLTTIGSFPQTGEIRKARQQCKKGTITEADYRKFLEEEVTRVVRLQEKLGFDVLVHGEPERNDMVEYFGELLDGYAFSDHGWVQSYGSRCVKPPILYGDIRRRKPMTVDWFKFAQQLTARPMKGMLTGPVTILNWSFVREDQGRDKTAYQVALAIRDEVKDLEEAGAKVIQIDEAALREGLPLKRIQWGRYLRWAADSFRLCSSGVKDETQIQTHMCYSEFKDIMEIVRKLDADVLLIEYSRSGLEAVECFKQNRYPNHIGPGVYDIHSPRVPTVEEIERAIENLLTVFSADQLWIDPDCGLKTRKYTEVEPALSNMVEATRCMRTRLSAAKPAMKKTASVRSAPA
ncbi:MAG: 5-methyltetrahydropteroyltriglutamate--homocysteine S-methyltransferase [Deltaproteobacteria bacterium]|nr:5-methyltetrahydropteroyltriglutamate--homocysteine S-methyltransferase [Deltaproteobacteria bacterium]